MLRTVFLCRPALAYQLEQVRQRVFVAAAFLLGELAGTLVELGRHLRRFQLRAAHSNQEHRQFIEVY